MNSALFHLYC